jgi:hypothetical protein
MPRYRPPEAQRPQSHRHGRRSCLTSTVEALRVTAVDELFGTHNVDPSQRLATAFAELALAV